MSTFLTLDYNAVKSKETKMSEIEKTMLKEVKDLDPHSTILSVTPRSKSLAEYQHFNYNIGYYSNHIWPSLSPELPMNILSGLNSTAVILVSNQDMDVMRSNGYDRAYIASHVLKNAPEIETNPNFGQIIHLSRQSPPTSESNTVLVLPNDITRSQYYAYDILSLGQYNFTTALLSDIPTIKKAETLIVPDEEIATTIINSRTDLDFGFTNLIILNLNGYGQIGDVKGERLDPNLSYSDTIQYEYRNEDMDNSVVTYSRQFDNPLNLSGYNYLKFDWLGQGKNETHKIQFSSASNRSIQYEFQDSWNGVKQLILSLDMTDNDFWLNKGSIQRNIINNGTWSDISRISIISGEESLGRNGMNNLDDLLFISSFNAESINTIPRNGVIELNQASIIPSTYPSDYKVISTYDNNIPFILQKGEGGYNIHYINVYPLLQNLHYNNLTPAEMYMLYGKILGLIEIDIPTYKSVEKGPLDLVRGGIVVFRNGTFTGDVTINSTSSTINTNSIHSLIKIDGTDSDIFNLSQIIPLHLDSVEIKSNSSTISGIYGFYTISYLPQVTVVNFIGNPAIISLLSEDGEERLIYGSNITITLDNAELLSRQPDITVNGISNFTQFHSPGELNNRLRTFDSHFVNIIGNSSFNTKYADKFILAEKAQFSGDVESKWTEYFKNNPTVNLIKAENLLKINTLGPIFFLVVLYCIYNFYFLNKEKWFYT
jgi:hypothetical protein